MANVKERAKATNAEADRIMSIAKEYGVEDNYFFKTTFDRYVFQIKILNELQITIEDDGVLCTKEYVKGRKNIYSHPAIGDYNRTTDSANKTVSTLIRILNSLKNNDDGAESDDLLSKALSGEEID